MRQLGRRFFGGFVGRRGDPVPDAMTLATIIGPIVTMSCGFMSTPLPGSAKRNSG